MDLSTIKECYDDFLNRVHIFNKIEDYYYGETDSLKNFKPLEGRSNLKININYVQKLVDEETSYSFANDITYTTKDGDEEAISYIDKFLSNKKIDHDVNLGNELVKFGAVFEINYIKNNEIKQRIVTPKNGYVYFDEEGDVEYFLHIFTRGLGVNQKTYIDVYSKEAIYHFNEGFNKVAEPTLNIFGFVPVGVAFVGTLDGKKTIYKTIKTLQDAYETNFSDISCEISDFRNAILQLWGVNLEETDEKGNKTQPITRDNVIFSFDDKSKQGAEWLIKNINDTFVKNTMDRQVDMIYSLTNHINNNEQMVSNLSGIALRSRLFQLEAKCKLNEKAMSNLIKIRLKCLFRFIEILEGKIFDCNNIKIQFTPNIPVDTAQIADILSKLPDNLVSRETKRSLLPFIENPISEGNKIKKELQDDLDETVDLDKIGDENETNSKPAIS